MAIEGQITGKIGKKGFTTYKRPGYESYYVRYYDDDGKQIANRSLNTTDKKEADSLAKKLREGITKNALDKRNKIQDIIEFFTNYYIPEKNPYLQELLKRRERKISGDTIYKYYRFINNYFIPFLQEHKIKRIEQIKINVLKDFQNFLIEKGLKPKSINTNINGAVIQIFYNLYNKGGIKEMPFTITKSFYLPEGDTRRVIHSLGIYETLMALQDNEIWKLYKKIEDIETDKFSNKITYKKDRLLCLLTATCGLRNGELFKIRKSNIIKIRRTDFLEVQGTKTKNAIRKVPIPTITLNALNEYITENESTFYDDYLFYKNNKKIPNKVFNYARRHFGMICGYDEKELKIKNFVFSGLRHFYKTLLQRSELKYDIVEYFMGHAVNMSNMDARYNDREALDDIFFEEFGIRVNDYVSSMCGIVLNEYEVSPEPYTSIQQIYLTDDRGKKQFYFSNVLKKLDYEKGIHDIIGDLVDKGVLKSLNDKDGLKNLFEEGQIDKKLYDDCIYYIDNNKI
jgi:integrase